MRNLLLSRIAAMRGERMIECLAIDILRMRGQMVANRRREVGVGSIWHASRPSFVRNSTLVQRVTFTPDTQ